MSADDDRREVDRHDRDRYDHDRHEIGVLLLSDARLPRDLAEELLEALPAPFGASASRLGALPEDPRAFWDEHRRQVDAQALLESIPAPLEASAHVTLALCTDDLFVSVMSYVFGLSQLGSRRCLLSVARLGEGVDEARRRRRVIVEATHELGHGLGLTHCPVAHCAMHRTLWPEQIDLKRPEYCPSCLAQLTLPP